MLGDTLHLCISLKFRETSLADARILGCSAEDDVRFVSWPPPPLGGPGGRSGVEVFRSHFGSSIQHDAVPRTESHTDSHRQNQGTWPFWWWGNMGVWCVPRHGQLDEHQRYRRAGRPTSVEGLVVLSMLSHFRDIDVE